ncbi:MAG TPA: hypothetical protein VNL69_00905, partial [Bacteroidota bacterium]|nr:hypothetical protein [Bacteroidota bacterium]
DPQFYDPETGLFFRDDADIGFRILDAGYKAIQPPDVVAWHPVQFPSVNKSFQHVKRYMFDPLLYRKHPRYFRAYIERKKFFGISLRRPMHYSSLVFVLSVLTLCLSAALGAVLLTWLSVMLALAAHIIFRYKFQGWSALKFWRQRETAAYVILPFVYLYWFVHGIRRFGGWKSIF